MVNNALRCIVEANLDNFNEIRNRVVFPLNEELLLKNMQ